MSSRLVICRFSSSSVTAMVVIGASRRGEGHWRGVGGEVLILGCDEVRSSLVMKVQ